MRFLNRRRDRVPDGIEPIIGFRLWRYGIGPRGSELHPLASPGHAGLDGAWEGAGSNWVVASCLGRGQDPRNVAPVEDCTCGFYALSSIFPLLEFGFFLEAGPEPGESGSGFVLGRVQLAGKIIEHEYGYRAERARVTELIPFRGTEGSIRHLAAQLGVPIGPAIDPAIDPTLDPIGPGSFRPPPPTSPSSIRKRVKEWVRPEAA